MKNNKKHKMRSEIRIRDKKSQEFWTVRELRRGWPLNPTLFNIRAGIGRKNNKGADKKCCNRQKNILDYYDIDDIVLLARREAELKEIMKRYRRFLERKGLSLSSPTNQR